MAERKIAIAVLIAGVGVGGTGMTQVAAAVFPHHEKLIFWLSAGLVVLCLIGLALLFFWPRSEGRSGGDTFRQDHTGSGDNIMDVRR